MDIEFSVPLAGVMNEGMDPLVDTPNESGDHANSNIEYIVELTPPMGVGVIRDIRVTN